MERSAIRDLCQAVLPLPHSADAPCGLRRRRPRESRSPKGKDGPFWRGRMENALQHYKAVTSGELQSSNVADTSDARHTRDTNATNFRAIAHASQREASNGGEYAFTDGRILIACVNCRRNVCRDQSDLAH